MLDEEINGLPRKYRLPFILCYLEGKTNEEAAVLLGCPKGTILSRLSRAREHLHLRLTRRGLALSTAVLATVVSAKAPAVEVSGILVATTVKVALSSAASQAAAGLVSARVAALAEGVVRAMFLSKVKVVLAGLLVVGLAGLGTGLVSKVVWADAADPQAQARQPADSPAIAAPAADPGKTEPPLEDLLGQASRIRQSQNNLKRIAIAFFNHNDTTGHLPANITDKNGKPLLSWRVAILPYIEQQNLYQAFKLDKPWDSEHNKQFSKMLPKIYMPVAGPHRNTNLTYYQLFVGPDTAYRPGAEPPRIPHDFPDGTSNTFLVAEAGTPVPWAKPEDLPYDLKKPLPKLGGLFGGDFNVALADGSTRMIARTADEAEIRKAITPADGEMVDWKTFGPPQGMNYALTSVDLKKIASQNAQLKSALESAQKEIKQAEEERVLLRMRFEMGLPNLDIKAIRLLKENAELQENLVMLKENLERLRKENAQLKKGLVKPVPPKPKGKN